MINHRRRERVIAACLTALAGYVDALGFLALGGYFVSFMSGNSTRLGIGLEQGVSMAALPLLLIALFVAGVFVGSLVGHVVAHRRRTAVVVLVALLLAVGAILHTAGLPLGAIVMMVLAMGAENTVFERNGEVSIGLTYMTGTLVKLGQRLTSAVLGGDRLVWIWYLLLWLALVLGTVVGAAVHAYIGLGGLWFAALTAVMLAWATDRFTVDRTTRPTRTTGPD